MADFYFEQMFEYYNGAKFNFDLDQVRAGYEEMHEKVASTERQNSRSVTRMQIIQDYFCDRRVLELACGGGFWTKYIAETAEYVLATDITKWAIEMAPEFVSQKNVAFLQCDARNLAEVKGIFNAAFHYNFFNYVPLGDWGALIKELHSKLSPGALVMMGGQKYRGDRRDSETGDYFDLRTCDNGQAFKLVDNIPDEQLIISLLGSRGSLKEYAFKSLNEGEGWWVKYEVTA